MKLKLGKRSYDTSDETDRVALKQRISHLQEKNESEELENILQQIRDEKVVTETDLEIYQLIDEEGFHHKEFASRYVAATHSVNGAHTHYSFLRGDFYSLPHVEQETTEYYYYALIDKLLYEKKRHDWNEEPCLSLRRMLEKFRPGSIRKSIEALTDVLSDAEKTENTFFGDELSENSDSDEEEKFQRKPKAKRMNELDLAKEHRRRARYHTYSTAMNGVSSSPRPDLKKPTIITYSSDVHRQAKEDLKLINARLEKGERLTEEFLSSLKTKFRVAQYRGAHYFTTLWDADGRRKHRQWDEKNLPQFSSAVLRACGVGGYHDFYTRMQDHQFSQQLTVRAEKMQSMLLWMQHSEPVSYGGFLYLNLFYLLQSWYTSGYDAFPTKMKNELSREGSAFSKYELNSDRPLLSTGDVPHHALRYAYGLKLYEGHESERLDFRVRKDGRAERPYSGKVYVSLHPLSDFTNFNPTHVTSLFVHGILSLGNIIAAERETSFLGYLHENRVVIQHVAKYPSFSGAHKEIYEYKYGLTKEVYEKLQKHFQEFSPHSDERKQLELVLGEYLCAYQEVRLIAIAKEKAEAEGAILIYRNEDGGFSLDLPATPTTAVKYYHDFTVAQRQLYEALSTSQKQQVIPLTQGEFDTQINATELSPIQKQKMRFLLFDCKQKGITKEAAEKGVVPIPIPTIVKPR